LYNCIVLILFVSLLVCYPQTFKTSICYLVFKDPVLLLRRRCDRRERISKIKFSVNIFLYYLLLFFRCPVGRSFDPCRTSERRLYRLTRRLSRAFFLFFVAASVSVSVSVLLATRGESNGVGLDSQGLFSSFSEKNIPAG
jgi:hypothetical protein